MTIRDKDEDELIKQAIGAYVNWCMSQGIAYQQPNAALTRVEGEYVYLSNLNGQLAKYSIKDRKIVVEE